MFHIVTLFVSIREALTRRCSVKKVFLEISQNSSENTQNTCQSFFLKKLQVYRIPLVVASSIRKISNLATAPPPGSYGPGIY